ncbi:Transcription factor 23 [Acipenser ruthenus]|uniref:Transcription factor 23 n=1 Tax=Acipenser ruthenus TaxID=7906 RepID=A0A662YJQ6_ACIRT|nr:Transcription factor 23 [Acipenser ruthenus]
MLAKRLIVKPPVPLVSPSHRSLLPPPGASSATCDTVPEVGSSFRDQQRVGKFQQYPENAARERSRVRNLRQAFHSLQAALPSVPPDTKLSKLDVLVLATNYIAHLTQILDQGKTLPDRTQPFRVQGYLHPVKRDSSRGSRRRPYLCCSETPAEGVGAVLTCVAERLQQGGVCGYLPVLQKHASRGSPSDYWEFKTTTAGRAYGEPFP